jgi:shikimate dehydrogenase
MIFAVAGNPISHSKSPYIYNTHFTKEKINACYTALAADSASEIATTIRELNLSGCNITAPFKEEIIPYCDEIDSTAGKLQSVNTLVFSDNKIKAFSTDSYGVQKSIESALGDINGKKALVLGAGGAGRMACYALHYSGANVTVMNRTFEKAKILAQNLGVKAIEVHHAEKICPTADIIVNTLPAGKSLFPAKFLKSGSLLLDAVYTHNDFRVEAIRNGVTVILGESWLLQQAEASACHFFNGSIINSVSVKQLQNYKKSTPDIIALTGFMGSGKSTVGVILADQLEYELIDIDEEILSRENMSIDMIFKSKGEPYFRDKESEILYELVSTRKKIVISCGGGIISRETNSSILKEKTFTVWLYAPINESFSRVNDTGRPLAGKGLEHFIELFENRKQRYAFSSDLLVRNYEKTPLECARRIYEEINLLFES